MTGKRTQIQPSDTTNMSQSETDAVNILFATNNAVRYTQHTQVSFQKLLPLLKNSRKEKAEKNVLIQVRANQSLNVKFIKKTTYFAPPPLPHIHT